MSDQKRQSRLASVAQKSLHSQFSLPEYVSTQPDSLQKFQWELENCFRLQRLNLAPLNSTTRKNKSVTVTEPTEPPSHSNSNELKSLMEQVAELKSTLNEQRKERSIEDRLDRLMAEITLTREMQRQQVTPIQSSRVPQPQYFPMPYPYPQQHMPFPTVSTVPINTQYSRSSKMTSKQHQINTPHLRRRLRRCLHVVLFTVFVRSEAKKLAAARKGMLRRFYLQKFSGQMGHAKNWLVQSHSYSIAVILQKRKIELDYRSEKRPDFLRQKQKLILQLINLGVEKTLKDCTSAKLSLFIELLYNLCRSGSFIMSRFWTAHEMEQVCISEYFGFLRIDESHEKALIGITIFMKLLVFNMLLQPHKFDSLNFPKGKEPLQTNMYIISSIYYHLAKEVVKEYLSSNQKLSKLGNWLDVKAEFIVECCQPLIFNCEYPEEGEFISGLLPKNQQIQGRSEWKKIKEKIKEIIEFIHKQMVIKGSLMRKNLKYKLYH